LLKDSVHRSIFRSVLHLLCDFCFLGSHLNVSQR